MTNNDIAAVLYRIKENIKAVENGNAEKPILDEIISDFLDLIELIKLFMISERDSYYGYFLMNMQFRANFSANCIAGIRLNEFPPVFESNPLLLCKFSLKEIIYIVCHEIEHVILNHPAEMVKANPMGNPDVFYEFNLAADASVNDRLDYEIKEEKHHFMSRPDGVITSDSIKKMLNLRSIRQLENYQYYFDLIRNQNNKPDGQNGQESIMQKQNQKDGCTGNGEVTEDSEQDWMSENTENGGQDIVTAANYNGTINDHQWDAGEDQDDAAAAVREFVNSAVGMMNKETRGMMPGSFMSQVDLLNKPPVISWQSVLKKYVGTITASRKKTRTRLNRRQPDRFDLSGEVDNKVLKIVVAIDTSASVSDSMISSILNEIFAILAKRKHDITVIECDSAVRKVYKAHNPGEIQGKVKGRGGTLFTPVIEYVNRDRYYRDALLIYFTDGYGESSIPRPKTYRNLWIVIDNKNNLSLKEPYGAVMTL